RAAATPREEVPKEHSSASSSSDSSSIGTAARCDCHIILNHTLEIPCCGRTEDHMNRGCCLPITFYFTYTFPRTRKLKVTHVHRCALHNAAHLDDEQGDFFFPISLVVSFHTDMFMSGAFDLSTVLTEEVRGQLVRVKSTSAPETEKK